MGREMAGPVPTQAKRGREFGGGGAVERRTGGRETVLSVRSGPVRSGRSGPGGSGSGAVQSGGLAPGPQSCAIPLRRSPTASVCSWQMRGSETSSTLAISR